MVIYPPDKEAEVMQILGPQADETANYNYAALKASNEVMGLSGRDKFFALYNRGTNLVELQDYGGAALMYDEAFNLYPDIPEADRPYRALWYQTGPYKAYYYTATLLERDRPGKYHPGFHGHSYSGRKFLLAGASRICPGRHRWSLQGPEASLEIS